MSVRPSGRERTISYEAVLAGAEFQAVKRRLRAVVVPLVVGFLSWYFLYVALAAFAPGLMARPVLGRVNVGLLLGLLQFVSTFAVTTWYAHWARTTLDPMTDRLREQLQPGGAR